MMADCQIACAMCGAQFSSPQPAAKYCSKSCRDKRERTRDRSGDKDWRMTHITCECVVCGVSFHPKRSDRNKTCSRACGLKWAGLLASIRSNGGRVTHTVHRQRCVKCRCWFTPDRLGAFYCSDECRRNASSEKSQGYYNPVPRVEKKCAECGELFTGTKRSVYCTQICGKRAAKRVARKKEKARLRSQAVEGVNPNKVFERDGWKCGICGRKTLRSQRGTYHPRAPELDHVQPLSLGGEHSYRNTQCACRECNLAKSNTPMGQLTLL